ncbi:MULTISPECIES: hypothetical protein [Candidatus Ichthyocystis]|uniref:Uncharacterized protein n=1 Tax=Candidatus Ichthyocystis hellenicum TaxID=1561003 RepID=A0A0S4M3F5_9BURK|nr:MULTISPECIES: hypothetical protein [Ichthyocystis]CUT17819.1 hypothetical protein Ark11_1000 [Candidatus Ichthyocystis hellenicum]
MYPNISYPNFPATRDMERGSDSDSSGCIDRENCIDASSCASSSISEGSDLLQNNVAENRFSETRSIVSNRNLNQRCTELCQVDGYAHLSQQYLNFSTIYLCNSIALQNYTNTIVVPSFPICPKRSNDQSGNKSSGFNFFQARNDDGCLLRAKEGKTDLAMDQENKNAEVEEPTPGIDCSDDDANCVPMEATSNERTSAISQECKNDDTEERVFGAGCSVPGLYWGECKLYLPKNYNYCNVLHMAYNCSIYKCILEKVDVRDVEFENFIACNVISAVKKKKEPYGVRFYQSCSLDLSVTRNNAKLFVFNKVSSCMNGIDDGEDVVLSEGMSIEDIKSLMLSNEFFLKLSDKCKLIKRSVSLSSESDIPSLVQSKIKIFSEKCGVGYVFSLSSNKKKSLSFIVNTKRMIERVILSLPEGFSSVVGRSTDDDIKSWFFSDCHGARIYKPFFKMIVNICVATHRMVLEDQMLLDNVSLIAGNIVGRGNGINSITSIINFHKLVENGTSVYDRISNLSGMYVSNISTVLENSIVLLPDSKLGNLSKEMVIIMSKHFVVDIIMSSVQAYKSLCKRKVSEMRGKSTS